MVDMIPTSTGIDDIIGGIPKGTALGIVGPNASGKTILVEQMAFDVMEFEDANGLIIDTEGSGDIYEGWIPRFNDRFNTEIQYIECEYDDEKDKIVKLIDEDEDAEHYMYVVDVRHIPPILHMAGREEGIDVSKKGKITLRPKNTWKKDIWESTLGEFVLNNTIKYLSIDSMTNPLTEFESGQQNLPARSTATNLFMLQIQKLGEKMDLAITTVHHETFNPQDPYDDKREKGGKAIGYNHKYMIHLQHHTSRRTPKAKKRDDNVRAVWIIRHPVKPGWKQFQEIGLNNNGFTKFERS